MKHFAKTIGNEIESLKRNASALERENHQLRQQAIVDRLLIENLTKENEALREQEMTFKTELIKLQTRGM